MQNIVTGRKVHLDLTYNCIQFFPVHTEEEIKALRLFIRYYSVNITGNPLHCGCSGFTQWLRDTLHDTSPSVICKEGPSTGDCKFSRDQHLVPPYECPHPSITTNTHPSYLQEFYTSIFVSIGVLLFTFIGFITGVVIYKYRHRILYNLECRFNIRLQRRVEDELEEEIQYDAFVSHSSADREWVMKTLRPGLEDNSHPPYVSVRETSHQAPIYKMTYH
jgi:hypothetical protein